ncbi:class I SAM-dependent methyltransferase [Phyllobacterium meliloti]|uniref:class I SAM-dependent methyltransferase n=1 Tax=Phyllobacterium meliloti TaxID=555317 RepID=UPI001D15D915|nr:class I SAM-dependent methyltransferase [Phyllobacterium sp. T1293]UGX86122.1 class I SAM-dependent methyltransferase [Phyllobacterium sp. T1293]
MDEIYTSQDLAALYDALNPARDDTAFYLRIAGASKRVLDLGCGTGLLACMLADEGHMVTGVEPARAMLDVARNRSGAENVRWIEGDARSLDLGETFDLVIMTGHVFQVFHSDEDVSRVLKTALHHLDSGGRLVFESRNPEARAWDDWISEKTAKTVSVEGIGEVDVQHRLISVDGDLVSFETDHFFRKTGKVMINHSRLRFLSQSEIGTQLRNAGFARIVWYGDWLEGPVGSDSPELIVIAERG